MPVPFEGAAPRHVVRSGNRGAVTQRRRVVSEIPMAFRFADKRHQSRRDNIDQRCGQRSEAQQSAALRLGRFVRHLGARGRFFFGDLCHTFDADKIVMVHVHSRMIMRHAVIVDMSCSGALMHLHRREPETFNSKTMRDVSSKRE